MKVSITVALVCCVLFALCGTALAADVETQSSATISSFSSTLKQGSGKGKIDVKYLVVGKHQQSSKIGVSSIKIYKSNGTYVTTITGTTANGLISTNVYSHSGVYTYNATSGVSYYAVVTVTATSNGITDSKTVKTNSITAP